MSLRKKLLARVHILKEELGWSEDDYRDFIFTNTGKDSAGKLDYVVLDSIVGRMEDLRRKRRAATAARAAAAGGAEFDRHPLTTKCFALAYELTADGDTFGHSNRMNRYLSATAAKICASGDWHTATGEDLRKLVAALKIEADKRKTRC